MAFRASGTPQRAFPTERKERADDELATRRSVVGMDRWRVYRRGTVVGVFFVRARTVSHVAGGRGSVGARMVLVERYVVTDRELIELTIYGATAAVEANDIEGTLVVRLARR